jgi:hypothetical protein
MHPSVLGIRLVAVTGSPVRPFTPCFSTFPHQTPLPRFCQSGRSLKLTPCAKRSSFLSATESRVKAEVASRAFLPSFRSIQYA